MEPAFDDVESVVPVTEGTLRTASGRPLPLEHTTVDARIHGPLAEVTVQQRFRNAGDAPIEAVYLFPLPAEASVHRMQFRIEDRIVRGVVKERAEARRAYEQARSEGRAATLLEEDAPSVFSLSIANVAPGAVIDVELAYQEVLAFDDGRWRFAFPMVAPARYREGDAPRPDAGMQPPRRPSGERGADVALTVRFGPGARNPAQLACPTHAVTVDEVEGDTRVTLRTDSPVANRDFVLAWRAALDGVRPHVSLERSSGRSGTFLLLVTPSGPRPDTEVVGGAGESLKALRCANCGGLVSDLSALREVPGLGPVLPCGFCGAMLTPGTAAITRAARPRDVLVLVDRSGSMRGCHATVHAAVAAVFRALPAGDAVQLVAFHHDVVALEGDGARFVANAPELAARATSFLDRLPAFGGTALERVLALSGRIPPREGRTRVVVLITDAAVGNEGRLLRRVPELIGPGARLFALGVGPSVDRRLVARLAQAGEGASDVVADAGDDEAIARFARRVREAGPVLTGIALNWEGAGVTDLVPAAVPELFAGQPLRVLGRFTGTGTTRLVITAATADGRPFRQELVVELPAQTDATPGLARLWARGRVLALGERAARDPATERDGAREALALSLEHAIVGPYTALIAEDSAVSVEPQRVRRGRLRVVSGREQGRTLVLDGRPRWVGRGAGADLVLSSGSVSRRHFGVAYEGSGFVLRDTTSTNGTRVDAAVVRVRSLAVGTKIDLGDTTLVFELLDESEPDAFFTHVPSVRVDAAAIASPAPARPGRPLADEARPPPVDEGTHMARSVVLRAPAMTLGSPGPAAPMAPPSLGRPMGLGGSPPPPPRSPAAAPIAFGAPEPMSPRARVSTTLSAPSPRRAVGPPAMPPPPGPPVAQRTAAPPQVPVSAPGSEPYPEHELRELAGELRGELDLVFLVDATGSMGAYIDEVRARLLELVEALAHAPLCRSLRLGMVAYRDHPPQDSTFVTQVVPLSASIDPLRDAVRTLAAQGGGDAPEAVTDGLYDLVRLDWRPGAVKAVVWFGDAPPHGVEPTGDGFPAGCPCENHWFAQAECCREMGVIVYAVGCLPALRQYAGAEAVYRTIARTTRGMFLPLREAHLLVPLIAGAAETALDGQRVDAYVARLAKHYAAELAQTDEPERVRWLTEALRTQGVRARSMAWDERAPGPAPLRFRAIEPRDVEAALERLRAAAEARAAG